MPHNRSFPSSNQYSHFRLKYDLNESAQQRQVNACKRSFIYRVLSGHNAHCPVRSDSYGLENNGPCIESSGSMRPKSRLTIIDDGYSDDVLNERN